MFSRHEIKMWLIKFIKNPVINYIQFFKHLTPILIRFFSWCWYFLIFLFNAFIGQEYWTSLVSLFEWIRKETKLKGTANYYLIIEKANVNKIKYWNISRRFEQRFFIVFPCFVYISKLSSFPRGFVPVGHNSSSGQDLLALGNQRRGHSLCRHV